MRLLKIRTLMCFVVGMASFATVAQAKSNSPVKGSQVSELVSKISNEKVKMAVEAWQAGDSRAWLGLFAPDAKLFDDGNPRNFKTFTSEAIGHERFTSISKVENGGLDIYGDFQTEKWGSFKTYFKFHAGKDGKFDRLDIGQEK